MCVIAPVAVFHAQSRVKGGVFLAMTLVTAVSVTSGASVFSSVLTVSGAAVIGSVTVGGHKKCAPAF